MLERYCSEIGELYPDACIILYGSVARGEEEKDSDIDVVVISDRLPPDKVRRYVSLAGHPPIQPIGVTYAEFEKRLKSFSGLYFDIMADGMPLRGKGRFEKLKAEYEDIVKKNGVKRLPNGWDFGVEKEP